MKLLKYFSLTVLALFIVLFLIAGYQFIVTGMIKAWVGRAFVVWLVFTFIGTWIVALTSYLSNNN